jgi:hypothetical protein
MRESATHLLFNRHEKTWGQSKGGKPQRNDGLEIFLTQCLLANFEKCVTCYAGN